jgi:hypothetical protein
MSGPAPIGYRGARAPWDAEPPPVDTVDAFFAWLMEQHPTWVLPRQGDYTKDSPLWKLYGSHIRFVDPPRAGFEYEAVLLEQWQSVTGVYLSLVVLVAAGGDQAGLPGPTPRFEVAGRTQYQGPHP